MQVVLEADAPRVNCPEHGPTVVAVPWARHDAGHTFGLRRQVAWLAVACSKTAVCELMRIAWRTVGAIVARVWADADKTRRPVREPAPDRHRRDLLQAPPQVPDRRGRPRQPAGWCGPRPAGTPATLRRFFDVLGAERCAQITHVSADAADWIADVVAERCPNAVRCADPFHVVAWATEALEPSGAGPGTTRGRWPAASPTGAAAGPRKNTAPRPGHERARQLKGARYALWKNPEDLTDRQTAKLAWIAKTDPRLYRAYLLKEGLRHVFSVKGEAGKQALDRWISWARRCRIPVFVELAGRIVQTPRQPSTPPSTTACPTD